MSRDDPAVDLARYLEPVLRKRRERHRLDGLEPPAAALALEVLCRFRLSGGQAGSTFANPAAAADDAGMAGAVTYDRAAAWMDVSLSTVKRLVRGGELPAVKIGGASRIRMVDLDEYLSRQAMEPGATSAASTSPARGPHVRHDAGSKAASESILLPRTDLPAPNPARPSDLPSRAGRSATPSTDD